MTHLGLTLSVAMRIEAVILWLMQWQMQGIKLESFIFDPFPLASNLQLVEVSRNLHFAPVKNANGASADTPDAAKEAVMRLSGRSGF